MRAGVWKSASRVTDRASLDALVLQVGRLIRHRGYVRAKVVSAMLLRYLPADVGYDWRGEAALHARLTKAALDPATVEYLTASARLEIAMIRERGRL